MQGTIARWGNSLALRLSKRITEDANLTEGAKVEIQVHGYRIVITPARPRYRLRDLLKGHKRSMRHGEFDWGSAAGKEEL
jgi:antitoxin MazE